MVIDFTGGEFAERFNKHILQDCLRQTNIRSAEGDQGRNGFISSLLIIFLAVLNTYVAHLQHLSKSLIIRQVDPIDTTEPTVSVLSSHITNSQSLILSQVNTDSLFSCLHIGEYLIEERVL